MLPCFIIGAGTMTVDFVENGALLSGDIIYPEVVFDCGQCFRFYPAENGYTGAAHGKVINVSRKDGGLVIDPETGENIVQNSHFEGKNKTETDIFDAGLSDVQDKVNNSEYFTEDDFNKIWRRYFDFNLSYTELEECFAKDEILSKTIDSSRGMRLLIQDPFETIISFIISANNNIGRIRKIIEKICMLSGDKVFFENNVYYKFPSPEQLSILTLDQLTQCGAGYRAPYIKETSKAIADGFDLDCVYEMEYKEAKKYLLQLKGIGPKVADCILLFAFNKKNAFPVDVWIRRVLNNMYGFDPKNTNEAENFAIEHFGEYAGIAQQYLFNYARLNKII